MITLHDLNCASVRADVKAAPTVLFVNPLTDDSYVVAGLEFVDRARRAADPAADVVPVMGVRISVEPESHELELALAALLAIRGGMDAGWDADGLRELSMTIRKYWDRGLDVPWSDMLNTR